MIRVVVDPAAPEDEALAMAADVIRAGGVVAIPTDTVYGLAADPFNDDAVGRVFALKGRGGERALPLIAADLAQVVAQLGALPPLALALAERFWPGPLTLLVASPGTLSPGVTGGTGKVGVRVPAHAVARGLCRSCQGLLTATSANVSGQPAAETPGAMSAALGALDALLDAGPAPGGAPSTIVDATGVLPVLVRAGAVPWEEVTAWLAVE